MPDILLHLIPASLYALLAVLYRRAPLSNKALLWARLLLIAGLLSHGVALFSDLFTSKGLRFGLTDALSLTLWLAMLIYCAESFITRLDRLLALAAPAAALAALLPCLLPGYVLHGAIFDSWLFRAHFTVAMLAYGFFTLAALHSIIISLAEKQLHRAELTGLPPLMRLENLLFRLIGIAFFLLTLTIGSGIIFSEQIFHQSFTLTHKVVFTLASWLLFGILLLGRHFRGWRGRVAQKWILAGFSCLLLAYIGSRFVLEVLLQRG